MATRKNFSHESRKKLEGNYNDFDKSESYDPLKDENIDTDAWIEFISYYRYYIDEFAVD